MLKTDGLPQLALAGINQQDFDQIQLVQGSYPFQQGLQKRIPGKILKQILSGPVNNIYVFYPVFGRPYTAVGFDDSIEITSVVVPPITIPALPPGLNDQFYDDFSGYLSGTISLFWAAGVWAFGIGVCQTIIVGYIDPFQIYAGLPPAASTPLNVPTPLPPPSSDPSESLLPPTDPNFQFPVNPPQVFLKVVNGQANNTCEGQGTEPVASIDFINYYTQPGGTLLATLFATSIMVGHQIKWNGLKVGRLADTDVGLVQGACPGPPMPDPQGWFLNANDGSYGQIS